MAAWRDERGLTVVEVLIAITILVVGVVTLMNAVSSGYLNVAYSGGEASAAEAARQVLEQLKNQAFNPGPASGSSSPSPGVNLAWSIAPVGTTPSPNQLARITVTVTWPTGSGTTQSTTFETLRAQ